MTTKRRRKGNLAAKLEGAKSDLDRWVSKMLRAATMTAFYRNQVKRFERQIVDEVKTAKPKSARPTRKITFEEDKS